MIAMCMIVRDEADTIESCLASWWGHVDLAVIVDTGSTDGTQRVIERFAAAKSDHPTRLITGDFAWCDDFAAARRVADQLAIEAGATWLVWCDADDHVEGARELRAICQEASADVSAFGAGYDYAQDQHGRCVVYLKRERIVRAGRGRWEGRVHEAQIIDGPVAFLPAERIEWRHRKHPERVGGSGPRNRRILESWHADEPTNPRVLSYLGTETASTGEHRGALAYFDAYLELPPGWPEEWAQVCRRAACCAVLLGDLELARRYAQRGMDVHPTWPDSALTLAEVAYEQGRYEHAAHWAREVLRHGAPDTLLIINPQDYAVQPHVILCGALNELGHYEQAVQHGELVLAACPDHPNIAPALPSIRSRRKHEGTAKHFLGAAQTLVAHDEQAKALTLLTDCVPYYVTDHPMIVGARSELRERLLFATDPAAYAAHYETGGEKPERVVEPEIALMVADSLPRAHFLARGLLDQAVAAPGRAAA